MVTTLTPSKIPSPSPSQVIPWRLLQLTEAIRELRRVLLQSVHLRGQTRHLRAQVRLSRLAWGSYEEVGHTIALPKIQGFMAKVLFCSSSTVVWFVLVLLMIAALYIYIILYILNISSNLNRLYLHKPC